MYGNKRKGGCHSTAFASSGWQLSPRAAAAGAAAATLLKMMPRSNSISKRPS